MAQAYNNKKRKKSNYSSVLKNDAAFLSNQNFMWSWSTDTKGLYPNNYQVYKPNEYKPKCDGPSCGDKSCQLCVCGNSACYKCYGQYNPERRQSLKAGIKNETSMSIKETINKINSAKAKSVYALSSQSNVEYPYFSINKESLKLFPTIDKDEEVLKLFIKNEKPFARPCPLNPVHGFVDSRKVSTYNQFLALVDEVNKKKGDDILEILLMPNIEANFSAIVTPKNITIGRGHDGATGGSRSIVINTPHSIVNKIVSRSVVSNYTKPGEVPFIEIVHGRASSAKFSKDTFLPYVVQVRSGNQPDELASDFIPKDTIVKSVHVVDWSTDLLEWKKQVETFVAGDVIYAQSMSCHGAVHGVAHNIPVITSHVPVEGEVLKTGTIAPLDAERIANLLKHMLRTKDSFDDDTLLYGWKFAHTLAVNNMAGGEELVAYCFYHMVMGGIAACLGEYRHAKGKRLKGFEKGKSRDTIFRSSFSDKRRSFGIIHNVLGAFLSPRFSGGFGGKPWAECAKYTIELQRNIVEIIKQPCQENINKAIISANSLAHAQHNGGMLFNKFGATVESIYDLLAQKTVVTKLLNLLDVDKSSVGATLLKAMNKPTPKRIDKLIQKWEISQAKKIAAQKKKQLKDKKELEKLKLQLKEQIVKKKALEAKNGLVTLSDKLLSSLAKFQLRSLAVDEFGKDTFRLQIKYCGNLSEWILKIDSNALSNIEIPTKPLSKSWYNGSGAKYNKVKMVNCQELDSKGKIIATFKFSNGMEVVTQPFTVSESMLQ